MTTITSTPTTSTDPSAAPACTLGDLIRDLPKRDVDRLRGIVLLRAADNRLASLVNRALTERARNRPVYLDAAAFTDWPDADLSAAVGLCDLALSTGLSDHPAALMPSLRRALVDALHRKTITN